MKELVLKSDVYKLQFLFGCCSFLYRDITLTKEIGFYSSIYHGNRWYDSRFATWQVLEINKEQLKLYGEWVMLPHREIWNFKMKENTLYWQIDCENLTEFEIDMIQQNYMLRESYKYWEVPGYAQGRFPEYFSNYKGLLWDRIFSMPQIKDTKIILYSQDKQIPKFQWISQMTAPDCLIVLENSDPNFCSRVIQTLFVNPKHESLKEDFSIKLASSIYVEG